MIGRLARACGSLANLNKGVPAALNQVAVGGRIVGDAFQGKKGPRFVECRQVHSGVVAIAEWGRLILQHRDQALGLLRGHVVASLSLAEHEADLSGSRTSPPRTW